MLHPNKRRAMLKFLADNPLVSESALCRRYGVGWGCAQRVMIQHALRFVFTQERYQQRPPDDWTGPGSRVRVEEYREKVARGEALFEGDE